MMMFPIFSCSDDEPDLVHPSILPDLSGLTWVGDDLFIAVHDAKNTTGEADWPRVSFLQLPVSEQEGVQWTVVDLEFPGPGGKSSDMESACSIPGGTDFLLVESGQEGANFRRIFHARLVNDKLSIVDYAAWPAEIWNVEASEVCRAGDQLVFMYAERAEGLDSTMLRWADFSLDPLTFGVFQEVVYHGVDPLGPGARPMVALDIDSDGLIYIVSAYDPDSDEGPYRSVVWRIGRVVVGEGGKADVILDENKRLASLDGLKVESVAIRETAEYGRQVFIGTDDEYYGGILRLLP
jgi:hypothetical protein